MIIVLSLSNFTFLKTNDLHISLKKIKRNKFDKLTSVGKYNFSP